MPGWYGNFTTYPVVVGTDLDEVSVFTLKLKIQRRTRIEPKYQKLTIETENDVLELDDENVLSFYKVTESTPIFLENTQLD